MNQQRINMRMRTNACPAVWEECRCASSRSTCKRTENRCMIRHMAALSRLPCWHHLRFNPPDSNALLLSPAGHKIHLDAARKIRMRAAHPKRSGKAILSWWVQFCKTIKFASYWQPIWTSWRVGKSRHKLPYNAIMILSWEALKQSRFLRGPGRFGRISHLTGWGKEPRMTFTFSCCGTSQCPSRIRGG